MLAAQDSHDRFESRRSTVYAPNGTVATSQPLAATAALSRLRQGNNAFDAAITAAAVLNVVEPTGTGIGGDVFALYRTENGHIGAMQSCGAAPTEATPEAVRARISSDEDEPSMPFTGPLTVTVPGTARGWEQLLDRFGVGSLAEALEPAIAYARDGFPVTEVIANEWKAADSLFTDQHARETFLPGGSPPGVGETVRFPNLAESLERIARLGADPVYEGHIADAIVDAVQDAGGFLSHADLAGFEPEFVDPISRTYHDATVYQLPPNNQGAIVLEALGIAEKIDATEYPPGSVERVHALVEAMKIAFHDGHHWITDPDYEDIPALIEDEWVADRAERVGTNAIDVGPLPPPAPRIEETDTVLVTVGDGAGNLVSLLNSRFAGFGSGDVAGNTGIALQNRGASFSLDPDQPNVIAPGKRPFHTLIPGMVRFDVDDWAAFGVMGGHMQPQGHLQVLTQLIADKVSLQIALDQPRWRHFADGTLAVEPRTDPVLQSGLVRRGHDVGVRTPGSFGGAQIVRRQGETLSAATEPRKDGVAVGF